jgi:hypothetical protein
LGVEYGYRKEDIYKLSQREVSDLIEAMYYRKTGSNKVKVEVDKELDEKILRMSPKNFKERKNGR